MMCLICLQEEEFLEAFFGPTDYELLNSENLLTSATLLNSIDVSDAEENLVEVPSNTPDPVEKKTRRNVRKQRTRVEP